MMNNNLPPYMVSGRAVIVTYTKVGPMAMGYPTTWKARAAFDESRARVRSADWKANGNNRSELYFWGKLVDVEPARGDGIR